jgi:hypothetical protein
LDYNERVDVVDLILQVLKEHEKNLDSIVLQLGETVSQQNNVGKISNHGFSPHKIVLHKWPDFREKCLHSDTIAFDFDNDEFKVFSLKNGVLYMYFETLPEVAIQKENRDKILIKSSDLMYNENVSRTYDRKLQCGLNINVKKGKAIMPNRDTTPKIMMSKIDPNEAKCWLSEELQVEKRAIIFGWIEL